MNGLSARQSVQEGRYEYPYHYIPVLDEDSFSQARTLSWGFEYLSYLFFVLDKALETGFESLLDVGCGDGRFLFELGRRVKGRRLAGIDYSERAVEFAKIMSPDIEWIYGRIEDREILKGKFDKVTLIETLEHIPPDILKEFVEGVHYHIREEGTLIVTVPSSNVRVTSKHYQHFDAASLAACLKPFFKMEEIYYLNRKSGPSLKIIKKLLSNRLFILNNGKLLRKIYDYYVRNLLISDEGSCSRIAVVCRKCR